MITLHLTREKFGSSYTIGSLRTPRQQLRTLEDKVREVADQPVVMWKIPKETAIPTGTYPLIIDMSARFKKLMPHILNVEGFEGIRIHAGNSNHDTEGCILLGWGLSPDGTQVTQSRLAVDDFMAEIEGYYDSNTPVQIEIT